MIIHSMIVFARDNSYQDQQAESRQNPRILMLYLYHISYMLYSYHLYHIATPRVSLYRQIFSIEI